MDFPISLADHAWLRPGMVVVATIAVLYAVARIRAYRRTRRRMKELKEEYDRVVEEQVGHRPAAAPAAFVIASAGSGIRALDAAERKRYADEWSSVQIAFVDGPAPALVAANRLIIRVMRERGYPIEHDSQAPDVVATFHPNVAVGFRVAHALVRGNKAAAATVEHLRQSFLHQRRLFELLLDNVAQVGLTERDAEDSSPYQRWSRSAEQR